MNANDELKDYTSSNNYYQCSYGLLITDGVKALADKYCCYWFLDIIASYQAQLETEEFQVWKLIKNDDNGAVVSCNDGNERMLVMQEISWTDFMPDIAIVWVEVGVALLPSEH